MITVIEVSSGEYGLHVDRMVSAIENGKNQRWRTYAVEESTLQEMEIEQLNSGGYEKLNYRHGCSTYQQFLVLLKRMLLQTFRNKVKKNIYFFLAFACVPCYVGYQDKR